MQCTVLRHSSAHQARDGAGVNVNRAIGNRESGYLDPFLLLDELHSSEPGDYIKGYPPHPHRGLEALTIMLEGQMEHIDHLDNRVMLEPGSAQLVCAGRGMIHAEMPRQQDGELWSLIIWLNLPAKHKLTPPRYQYSPAEQTPTFSLGEANITLYAGPLAEQHGPLASLLEPTIFSFEFATDGQFFCQVPSQHQPLLYCLQGEFQCADSSIRAGELVQLSHQEHLTISAVAGTRGLYLSASPLDEPVFQEGPFVMDSELGLKQAVDDYLSGRFVDPQ